MRDSANSKNAVVVIILSEGMLNITQVSSATVPALYFSNFHEKDSHASKQVIC